MRLSQQQQQAIIQTIHKLDSKARIYLFGSRLDDTKKGGDIDLLVLSQQLGFTEQRRIKTQLYQQIGEQKIDLIIAGDQDSSPFVQLIFDEAILLA